MLEFGIWHSLGQRPSEFMLIVLCGLGLLCVMLCSVCCLCLCACVDVCMGVCVCASCFAILFCCVRLSACPMCACVFVRVFCCVSVSVGLVYSVALYCVVYPFASASDGQQSNITWYVALCVLFVVELNHANKLISQSCSYGLSVRLFHYMAWLCTYDAWLVVFRFSHHDRMGLCRV